jgi:UDP-N-acetylglucosamine 3-dehydrogenase
MIRAALIGYGTMGRNHARVLDALPEVELVAIADADLDSDIAKDPRFVSDIRELFALKPDYCVIATPTNTHYSIAKQAAAAGVTCLIEKPVALNTQEAIELEAAFAQTKTSAYVGHIERFNPALSSAKLKIASGLVGRVLQVSTTRHGPFPGRISDVGVAKDLATHDIDLTRWLTGAEYVRLNSETLASHSAHEDSILATGRLNNGVLVSHSVNWISPKKVRSVNVLGEKGLLEIDLLKVDLTFFENGTVRSVWDQQVSSRGLAEGDTRTFAISRTEPLRSEHEACLIALSGGAKTDLATLVDGRIALSIASQVLDIKGVLEG